MKRSDLSTREVLTAIREHQFNAFQVLASKYPSKVVRAALTREAKAGRLEYGVSLDRPWLTPHGERQLDA
ncbi:hypothetical protein [Streptomyces sp. NPDC005953]|uniref:hypothetical protein n=1 Tax=Streptomyces sp. NPDC005953 TaxID=3156719 RepID=UPI0034045AAA